VSWLEPTKQITVQVVVANVGDVVVRGAKITARLSPVAASVSHGAAGSSTTTTTEPPPAPQSVSHVIPSLLAAASMDVTLPQLKVAKAGRYELTVSFGGESLSVTLQVAGG
jgi:hypothetical protein